MNTTKIQCHWCKNEIEKPTKEVTRSKKQNRHMFCNSSCSTKHRNNIMPKSFWKTVKSNIEFKKNAGNRQDDYSPFRPYLCSGRASNKKHNMNLTPEYLKLIWEKQNGTCPYTGIKMILPKNTTKIGRNKKCLKKASLDRIDSSKGYVEGNVEFVCMAINNAKNNFSKEDMTAFISEIIQISKEQN